MGSSHFVVNRFVVTHTMKKLRSLSPRGQREKVPIEMLTEVVNRGGFNELKKMLKGKVPEGTNDKQQSLLHIASIAGQTQIVTWLIEARKSNVNAKDNDNWTPLFWALDKSKFEVAEQLIVHNAEVCIEAAGTQSTPLDLLVRSPEQSKKQAVFERVFRLMVDAGAEINKSNAMGETPLHIASMRGKELSVRLLLGAKADPSIKNKNGETAIHFATRSGQFQAIQQLLEAGSDYNEANGSGVSALDIAKE